MSTTKAPRHKENPKVLKFNLSPLPSLASWCLGGEILFLKGIKK
jgi:hypothetical protein